MCLTIGFIIGFVCASIMFFIYVLIVTTSSSTKTNANFRFSNYDSYINYYKAERRYTKYPNRLHLPHDAKNIIESSGEWSYDYRLYFKPLKSYRKELLNDATCKKIHNPCLPDDYVQPNWWPEDLKTNISENYEYYRCEDGKNSDATENFKYIVLSSCHCNFRVYIWLHTQKSEKNKNCTFRDNSLP